MFLLLSLNFVNFINFKLVIIVGFLSSFFLNVTTFQDDSNAVHYCLQRYSGSLTKILISFGCFLLQTDLKCLYERSGSNIK